MAQSTSRDFIDIGYLGCTLANFRKKKRLSQWQVAKSASISQSVLGKIESGQSMPLLSTALAIADCLDVDLFELIKYKAPQKDDVRLFYAKYKVMDSLTNEQSNIIVSLAKNMANMNVGIRYVS
jgi:transcriptional regulator with XRE-family HTH domain